MAVDINLVDTFSATLNTKRRKDADFINGSGAFESPISEFVWKIGGKLRNNAVVIAAIWTKNRDRGPLKQ